MLAAIAGAYGIGVHLGARARTGPRRLAVAASLLGAGFSVALPIVFLTSSGGIAASAPAGALLAGALVLPGAAALAMGAVFASLFRGLRREPSALGAGLLAAANALGGGAGAFAAATWGVVGLGSRWTGAAAGGLHLLAAGAAALALSPRSERRSVEEPRGGETPTAWILAALLAAGFVSLGVQMLAARTATVLFEGFTPVYAAIVGVSLGGLALGAAVGGLVVRGRPQARALSLALLLAAIGTGAASWVPAFLLRSGLRSSPQTPEEWLAGLFGGAALLTLPAMLPLGACFPIGFAALGGSAARRAARAAAALSLGSAAGPPIVGLFLVPAFGVPRSSVALGVALFGLALPVHRRGRRTPLVLAAVGAAAMVVPALLPSAAVLAPRISAAPEISILAARDDVAFSVAVIDDAREGERTLVTDAFRAAGTGEEYRYMRALAHLPARLHGNVRRACVIGLGIGSTAGALALHPSVERLEVVEISPSVIAFASYFSARNAPLFARSEAEVAIVCDDGRRRLLRSEGGFDLVTLEPLLPTMPAAVHFYTREFLDLARRRLAPGGMLCHWVPLHALSADEVDRIVATFVRAFPSSSLFVVGPSLILVGGGALHAGTPRPAPLDGSDLARDLADVDLEDPEGVERLRLCGGAGLAERLQGVPDLTDDRPSIERVSHRSPREAYAFLHANLSRLLGWFEGGEEDPDRRFARRFLEARIQDAAEDLAERGYAVTPGPVDAGALYGALLGAAPRSRLVRAQRDAYRWRVGLREGFALLQAGLAEEAMLRIAEAAEARPFRFEPRFYLAAALAKAGRARAALLQAARAFVLVPRWRELSKASAPMAPARGLLEEAGDLIAQAEALARRAGPPPADLARALEALRGGDDARRLAAFRALAVEPGWRDALEEGDRRRALGWSRAFGLGEEPLW